jgi:hypothetical protein
VLDIDDSAVNLSTYVDADVLRALVEEQRKASTSAAAAKRAQKRHPVSSVRLIAFLLLSGAATAVGRMRH